MKPILRFCALIVMIAYITFNFNPSLLGALEAAPAAPASLQPITEAPAIVTPVDPASQPPAAMQQPLQLIKNTETFPLYTNDRPILGENGSEEFFFEIAKGSKVLPGSYVDIYYAHSPLLRPQVSNLTILMDNVPISSVILNETNVDTTLMRIDISKYLTTPGFHKLSFQAHMEFSNNTVCADPYNAANWMVISKNSQIHLNLDNDNDNINLNAYPSPFFKKGSQQPLQAVLVVPDDIDPSEFAAAAQLVQFFSSQAPSTRINVPIFAESDLTDGILANNHTLWLGLTGHWKERGKLLADTYRKQMDSLMQDQGMIAVGASPWNAKLSGMMIMGSKEQLTNAAMILTDPTLFTQLQGKAAAIPAELKSKEFVPSTSNGDLTTISFEKMGYNNLTIGGRIEGNSTINFNIPSYSDVDDGAKLTLAFKHSKAIDYGNSVISVKLNGIPVVSHKLSEATSDAGLIEVQLTQDLIELNRTMSIEISFRFASLRTNQTQTEACIDPNFIGNWAVVDKASTISYTAVDRKNFNLQSIPYSFIKNERWNDAVFLVPEKFGSKELNTAMTLVGILGRNAFNSANLTLIKTSANGLKDLLRDKNIIYLGTAKDLPDFMNGFPDSSVEFKDNKILSTTKNVELLSGLQTRSAVIQLSRSPLNEGKSLLVLAATSPDRQESLSKALTEPNEYNKIIGRFVVIDNQNSIHSFPDTTAQPTRVAKSTNNQIADFLNGQNKGAMDGTIFVLIFILILAVIVVILWLVRRRNK